LTIAYEHAARFGTGYYLQDFSFNQVIRSTPFAKHAARFGLAGLCDTCQQCRWRNMCGGGMLPHRYGVKHGFNAPSIYCGSLAYLLAHVESAVLREVEQAKERGPIELYEQMNTVAESSGRENRMDNVSQFLEDWDRTPAQCSQEVLPSELSAEHVNVDGDIQNPTSLILTHSDSGFLPCIERGVKRLVEILIYRLGLVTYSSCQGHATGDNDCRERTVGILPRSEEERVWIFGLLQSIADITALIYRDQIPICIENDAVVDSCGKYATVEIVFARNGKRACEYLKEVEEVSGHFTETLDSLTGVVRPEHMIVGAPVHVEQQWESEQRHKRSETDGLKELHLPIAAKEEDCWDVVDAIKQQLCNLDVLKTWQQGDTLVLRHRGSIYPDERHRVQHQISRSKIVIVNNHAWALSVWLRLLLKPGSIPATRKVAITHLDYHSDMMVPLLSGRQDPRTFVDVVRGRDIRLDDMETIDEAIASTAIGPGSFIIPFVAALPATRVLHVIPTGQQTQERPPSRDRGTIEWTESPMSWSRFEVQGASWSQASHPSCLIPSDEETWILDIDCDYFDNSLGGNTGVAAVGRSRVPVQVYAERIALVRDWLASLQRRPDVVTIALSADFCPLEVSVEAMKALLPFLHDEVAHG